MRIPSHLYFIDILKDNKFAFVTVAMCFVVLANLIGHINMNFAIFFVALLIAIISIVIIFKNPVYAITVNLFTTVLLFYLFYRLLGITSLPLGFVLEGLNFLAILSLLLSGKLKGGKSYAGTLILIWLGLCIVEFFNPFAASRVAWFQAIRHVLNNVLPIFIIYSLLVDNPKSLKIILNAWLILIGLAAVYTLYQEFAGFPPWDYAHVTRNEMSISLNFTFGRWRKFSFFSNPTECGVVMAMNAVICLGLAFQKNLKQTYKITYLIIFVLSAWAMMYTGTRTATVIFVFGAAIYVLLNKSREVLTYAAIITVLLVGYVTVKGGGQAMYVMTTAFNPDEDPSMQVRMNNQRMLRRYLMRSPMGYGMGSTGYIGMRFSGHTFLGSFPPDSELVRLVVEVGMVGLAFYLFMFFVFISKSLASLKHPPDGNEFIHNFKMIVTAVLFMLLLGQYPQEILNIGSIKILLALCIAFVSIPEESRKKLLPITEEVKKEVKKQETIKI